MNSNKTEQILVIDDEENMRHMLKSMLKRQGFEVDSARNGLLALQILERKKYDFILCDIKMPEMGGMEFLDEIKEKRLDTTVIMMSAYGNIDHAIGAMQKGAYDYISKPFNAEEIFLVLKKAEEREKLRKENRQLRERIASITPDFRFGKMVGKSKKMINLFNIAQKAAEYPSTVLITGESGTGKELVARAIHENSPRKKKPFIAINCGSIPENLLESELFGYKKGAFTGADKDKQGLFDAANKGTLLLDEIGDLPLPMQVKLLRVIQEQEIMPIGANQSHKVDVRLLAATAQNLEVEIGAGRFRQDLFYRLNVINIEIPPLRERQEDIPVLCNHFLKKFNLALNQNEKVKKIEAKAMDRLLRYRWPGNVRELENCMERASIMCDNDTISIEHLPGNITSTENSTSVQQNLFSGFSLKKAQKELEKQLISHTLEHCRGNKSKAAELLEISYPSLLNKIKLYDL